MGTNVSDVRGLGGSVATRGKRSEEKKSEGYVK